MAWKVELSSGADRELNKLDAQHARRILRFLHERVAKLDDPRSIGEALQGSRLGSGNTAWAITGSSARSKITASSCWLSASDIVRKSIANVAAKEENPGFRFPPGLKSPQWKRPKTKSPLHLRSPAPLFC
jgi:hypothetical protein